MSVKTRKKIIPQMFDVRPVNEAGDLDFSKISNVGKEIGLVFREEKSDTSLKKSAFRRKPIESTIFNTGDIRQTGNIPQKIHAFSGEEFSAKVYQFGRVFPAKDIPVIHRVKRQPTRRSFETEIFHEVPQIYFFHEKNNNSSENQFQQKKESFFQEDDFSAFQNKSLQSKVGQSTDWVDDMKIGGHEYFYSSIDFNKEENRKEERSSGAAWHIKLAWEDFHRFFSRKTNKFGAYFKKNSIDFFSGTNQRREFSFLGMFTFSNLRQAGLSFSGIGMLMLMLVIGVSFFNRGLNLRDSILGTGKEAYFNLASAKEGMLERDFSKSSLEFSEAQSRFESISRDLNSLGGILIAPSQYIPYLSKLSSGDNMAQAGKNISQIGILAGEIFQITEKVKNPLNKEREGDSISFLEIFEKTDKNLREILELLEDTEKRLAKINVEDIPEENRAQFVELKNKLPEIKSFIANFLESSRLMTDVLGGNGPRKYLFLFQNNQEMRATGGFIGTYGVIDIFNGHVRNFFIDGIYNPDGQLREKIIPPTPIQKMSANWSLHDSNWFPDFPKSAEKAAWFYEKTGGPTVDGVITMTPSVMQKLLEITGPIEMDEYGITVDKDNFIETIQQEVEADYDKELNQPKKILADLAPMILDRIFNVKSFVDITKTLEVFFGSLNEKQILIYSKNYEIEKMLSEAGWSGEILKTEKDYLSVINTNINGYKTDGVIDEEIVHQADIQEDGSIMDTVTIKRVHRGGNLEKDWWNKVNADYMRVYVPRGSKLISADGQTREFNSPPLDYKKLGFRSDPQLSQEEESMTIDDESGTRIYEDGDKTVFANWVYVSPQESVEITYKYLLPWKVRLGSLEKPADTYSLLIQKQSGSLGSKFRGEVNYPEYFQSIWSYPEKIRKAQCQFSWEADLREDRFMGVAFIRK